MNLRERALRFFDEEIEPELRRAGTSEVAIHLARRRVVINALNHDEQTLELLEEYRR